MQTPNTLGRLNQSKMNRRSLLRRGAALGLALPVGGMLLNACSSGGDDDDNAGIIATPSFSNEQSVAQPAETVELTIRAFDLGFDPDSLTVDAGQKVRLTFVNDGAMEHDWEVTGLTASDFIVVSQPEPFSDRLTEHLAEMETANIPYAGGGPGQEMIIEFTPDEPGEYEMVCLVPGHKEAGMAGPFIVTGESAANEEEQPAETPATTAAAAEPYEAERLPNPVVAPPVGDREPELVKVEIEIREVIAAVDDGVAFEFWTFGGTIPGPMVRARVGDTVEVTLTNPADSLVTHNIDFHAATGPGGGAHASVVAPGESATFRFKALSPGAFVYHCATAPVPHHISAGMYGLAIIEPEGGFDPVDKEFYVMQGDLYLEGAFGDKGLRPFSMEKMIDERPDYVIFNGSAGSLVDDRALTAEVGDTVRIFFGVGGPNITSSFHVIGEIFDRVAQESASEWSTNVQTTMVPAGGAAIVEFTCDYPGTYMLVDHSLSRLMKGAAGQLVVEGEADSEIFEVVDSPSS